MKIALLTLGCRTNQAESLRLEHSLQVNGHQIVDMSENPDICIINTCTVTSRADYQSRQLINRALKIKAKVIVTGCYSELNFERTNEMSGDVEVVKNEDKLSIINMISPSSSGVASVPTRQGRYRPIIKVQDGCNYSCSYCAIPKARGRSKSIPADEVIREISYYDSMGYSEVVLTGIHLGTYGYDLNPQLSLADLLEKILSTTNVPRIRLSSLEIREIDDRFLELFSDPRLCNHLHVPLQSGDEKVLKLMNRIYSSAEYVAGIEKITKKIPGLGLGTDVIVGFPGEGEREFLNTKSLLESLPFSYLHIFPYSQRPGTRASSLPDQQSGKTIKRRAALLREIGVGKKQVYLQAHSGKQLDVILEHKCAEVFTGTTRNYIKVSVPSFNGAREGMLVNITIAEVLSGTVRGTLIN